MKTVMLIAIAFAVALPAAAQEGPFKEVRVVPDKARVDSRRCPVEVVFTGTIDIGPSAGRDFFFHYRWERSDGTRGNLKVVRPRPGQRSVNVRERWRVGERGREVEAGATLHVNSGGTRIEAASPRVKVRCS